VGTYFLELGLTWP